MGMIHRKTLTALFGSMLAGAVSAATPSYDHYKSWLVACDNALTCEAKGFTQDSGGTPDLRVVRAAGPAGSASVVLTSIDPFGQADLRIDGKPIKLDPSAWRVNDDRSNQSITFLPTRPEAMDQLLSQLRNGKALQVGKDPEHVVPLDGMVAALLRMDDRQGRIGNVTAWIRKGSAPASAVPAAPALPVVPPRKITANLSDGEAKHFVEQFVKKDADECDDSSSTGAAAGHAAYALDAKTALVLIACNHGAYQTGYDVHLVSRQAGNAELPLRLPEPVGHDDGRASVMEADFDPKTGTLSSFGKGRGIADCGEAISWVWDGRNFLLSSAALQTECGGSQPGDFPTLYRTAK
ncbi:DUF1176 domain-containing protein [Burkholderia guangdongensis]|uniref:DUF1176 domain-containing protein n=1 Tax=Burkholderia guangdongensis TaxID=1792500 RepID=UPI0015C9716A|nr:DUF1176 domain-containing protein [Burkholderia guangdongensis]